MSTYEILKCGKCGRVNDRPLSPNAPCPKGTGTCSGRMIRHDPRKWSTAEFIRRTSE